MSASDVCPPTLEDAIALAVQAHQGQVYPTPSGEPFILHPLRVMLQVEADIERIVAVLHDMVEDTAYTLDDVRRLGYPDEAIEALDRLTRREGEAYEEYIGRIVSHPIARRVKLADLTDNLANSRQLEANAENRERIGRYERARERLMMVGEETSGVGNRHVHVHVLPVYGPYDRVTQEVLESQEAHSPPAEELAKVARALTNYMGSS